MAPYAVCGALVSVLLGYDFGTMGAALEPLRTFYKLTDLEVELLVGSFSITAAFASPLGAVISDLMGRRFIIAASSGVATVGALLMACSPSFELLALGRVIEGFGVGAGLSQAPSYLVEMAPPADRGQVVSMLEVFLNVGIFSGFLAGKLSYPLGTPTNFRIMFGLGTLPALLLSIVMPMMPESPRWLVRKGRRDEASVVLLGVLPPAEADQALAEMEQEEQEQCSHSIWAEMNQPWFLKSLMLTLGISLLFALTGIDIVAYYGSIIMSEAGCDDDGTVASALVLVGAWKTISVAIAVVYFDRVGRRQLFIASFVGMGLAHCTLVHMGLSYKNWYLCLVGLMTFTMFFSIGLGPGFYLLTAEVWPTRFRATGASLAALARSLHCSAVQLSFLRAAAVFGTANVMFFYGQCALAGGIFVYFCMPETLGRTLEQIISDQATSQSGSNRSEVLDGSPTEKLVSPETEHPKPEPAS